MDTPAASFRVFQKMRAVRLRKTSGQRSDPASDDRMTRYTIGVSIAAAIRIAGIIRYQGISGRSRRRATNAKRPVAYPGVRVIDCEVVRIATCAGFPRCRLTLDPMPLRCL